MDATKGDVEQHDADSSPASWSRSQSQSQSQSHSQRGVEQSIGVVHDEVFSTITDKGPNFRNVGWLGTSALMMKCQIGLGVLSIPDAFDKLGLIPGLVCLLAISAMMAWCNYMVGVSKLRHRELYGVADVGNLLFGKVGREILSTAFCLFTIFGSGGSMLGAAIGLNAVSKHGACTAIFVAVSAIAVILVSSIRTLGRLTFVVWAGLSCLLVSIMIVTIAVGVQDRPESAPQDGPWKSNYKLVGNPSFEDGMSAVTTYIFAYAGVPFFFPILSEMRDPRQYNKSLVLCQTFVTVFYVAVGIVIYYYCGSYVSSPALGSAGSLVKRISYGIALPGLIVNATMGVHLGGKYIFVRILRGSHHLSSNTVTHWVTWLGCVASVGIVAYVIASGIPSFEYLVALIGALFGTLQCFIPMGMMWLYENWHVGAGTGEGRTVKWYLMVCWSVLVILLGTFFMVGGTYGSIVGIIQGYRSETLPGPWMCADNSNSV